MQVNNIFHANERADLDEKADFLTKKYKYKKSIILKNMDFQS